MYVTITNPNGSMIKKGTYLVQDIYGKPFISYQNDWKETVYYYIEDLIRHSILFTYHKGD